MHWVVVGIELTFGIAIGISVLLLLGVAGKVIQDCIQGLTRTVNEVASARKQRIERKRLERIAPSPYYLNWARDNKPAEYFHWQRVFGRVSTEAHPQEVEDFLRTLTAIDEICRQNGGRYDKPLTFMECSLTRDVRRMYPELVSRLSHPAQRTKRGVERFSPSKRRLGSPLLQLSIDLERDARAKGKFDAYRDGPLGALFEATTEEEIRYTLRRPDVIRAIEDYGDWCGNEELKQFAEVFRP